MADAVLPEADFAFTSSGTPAVTWKVARFQIHEALSEPYEAMIEIAEEGRTVLTTLLGQPCDFSITRGSLVRHLSGIVRAAEDLGSTPTRHHVRVYVVPALWLLSQRVDARIYQDLSVVDIVREVLKGANLYQDDGRLVDSDLQPSNYPIRECCVQYHESDLAFVSRLLEDEGITFYFKQTGGGETLVLTSDAPSDPFQTEVPTLNGLPVRVMGSGGSTFEAETVRQFRELFRLQPTSVTLRDWDFTRPFDPTGTSPGREAPLTHATPTTPGDRPVYQYPGYATFYDYDGSHYYHSDDLARRASIRNEENAWQQAVSSGEGVVVGFAPGLRVTLLNEDGQNVGPMVITAVDHSGRVGESEGELHPPTGADRYTNSFELIPVDSVHRPVRHTPRPMIRGPQTAMVMARPNSTEEVCIDSYGRVLLRFHWERPDKRSSSQSSKQSSAWVRVSQPWAGSGWGVVFNPRVGMEVVVQFIEGNPDWPLVTGCVYNLHNPPPPADELVAKKTRSTLKTNSSPGGGGFNELYFEDQKGSEQIYLYAQKDFDELVLNNHSEKVNVNENIKVGNNQTVSVGKDQSITVGGNHTAHVTGTHTVTVDGSGGSAGKHGSLTITGDLTMDVSNDIAIKAGNDIVVTAADKMTLSVGGSSIVMVDGKVTITDGAGATITLDSGDVKIEANNITSTAQVNHAISGVMTKVSGTAEVEVKGAMVDVEADAMVGVKGAIVNISGDGLVAIKGALVTLN